MNKPLMPKATATWLIENTSLTFQQIATFCDLHVLEVQSIADGEVGKSIIGIDPVATGQLTHEEITRCESNPNLQLSLSPRALLASRKRVGTKRAKYTPLVKRRDKPDGIAWLLKHCPELTEGQIVKLIGTTKMTIAAVRDKTHWNSQNIKPRDPVMLSLCTQTALDSVYGAAKEKALQKLNREREMILKGLEVDKEPI
ncbi:DUF1013 domain-containing protein [Rickettsiales endosymbiont of Peranema trichophorum]|uniref:cell cycle transcriptional regulator TrcR n=1 Tax=Rickettsiales endosymbiont of Peranema trichophorum TaxID=2486577 RepID=UPI0010237343|nr:cell cycle transcriptional regulator TrcR [Rickettsiales endosymbiont of Peranema trichophorum]RZI47397.1 DUF1013 domain-containing protein [Rickettsiales endosymbiont of Peranema trichophorum]